MHRAESSQQLVKIFILAFLCSEMHSSFTQSNAAEQPFNNYASSINGSEASLEHARYQASIRLALEDYIFGEGHICGGAVIAPSVVLTVGQCVHNYRTQTSRHPAELKVVMGTLNRYQRTEHTLVYGVTHVHQPKTFSARTLRDNIAIIMLERDIPPAHPTVKPIALSSKTFRSGEAPEMLSDSVERQTFEVTSWFATEQRVPYTQLMSLNASQLSDEQCVEKYGPLYGPDTVCIGYKYGQQEAACEQDAGSPLIHNNQLLALTSTQSVDCKKISQPVVFVDVAHHAKWILEQIGDGTNCNSSVWGTLAFLLFTIWTAKRAKWHKFLL
ncbi:PREDICTED: vitellin-degrading protease [Rhagoletis zephyria]|uniref:vitellin-degrading protease n=1 Tax=Rhagoletis zephyria TaxID=28612 RepID=UPI00081146A3|nr:PREDICTED: vitellin-degrading protease [Rhagoletis zephyria]